MAERILGTALVDVDAAAAGAHLESARHVLQEVGADNEIGKLLVAQSALRQAAGDVAGARDALRCALDIFERLGTLDEPPRVRSLLAALG